jgi:hypothetical protein
LDEFGKETSSNYEIAWCMKFKEKRLAWFEDFKCGIWRWTPEIDFFDMLF